MSKFSKEEVFAKPFHEREQDVIDLMGSDLDEEECLREMAEYPDQEAVASVTGGIVSLLVPEDKVSKNTQPQSERS